MITPNIKTTDFDMTPETEAYVEEKFAAIERVIPEEMHEAAKCDIELAKTRNKHTTMWRAEINLVLNGKMLRADATGESVQAALDIAKDEMLKRVRRSKRKRTDLMKRGGARLKRWMRFGRGNK